MTTEIVPGGNAFADLNSASVIVLDHAAWAAFVAKLDAPIADNPRLRQLLGRKPAWEK